jgi:dolichyl-phosphate beta-glucosyltransferase
MLSVVIPSYNEVKNFQRGVLNTVIEYLKQQPYTWEVILTDDGSTDGTVQLLTDFAKQHPNVRFIPNNHGGKAPTVTSGMLAAQGEHRLFTDFDQSTPLSEVEKMWPYIEDGADIVIGSRAVQGARRDKEPWYRHIMGKVFNLVVQIFALPGIHDTQCGFKLFSAEATTKLFPQLVIYRSKTRTDAFTGAFDVELLFLAKRNHFSIAEVPVLWEHNQSDRVNPIKDSLRMFIDILKIRWAAIMGYYHGKV